MSEKYTIITISDHPLASSGVGIQTKYIIERLVESGKFRVISIAAAIKHEDYRPQKVKEWGDDVVILPVDGYGNPEVLRKLMYTENPDAIWIMTDPRFYQWLFQMENEVHKKMPILYNTIWDNYPPPLYNKPAYEACDFLGCINKLTYDIVCKMGFEDRAMYIPHGVKPDEYKPIYEKTEKEIKLSYFGVDHKDSFVMFYNSRNAMRKRTGNVIMAFKEFRDGLPEEDRDKVLLLMHTPPKDKEGQDLHVILRDFGLVGSVKFSDKRVNPTVMNEFYNMSHVTISMSSEEGFGLSILESLMAGTPVICTKTGGMQDQVLDPETGDEFGFCLEPQASSLIGSQITPYIWQDHLDPSFTAGKIREMYYDWKSDPDGYKERWAGEKARASMLKRFNLNKIQDIWLNKTIEVIESFKQKKASDKKVRVYSV